MTKATTSMQKKPNIQTLTRAIALPTYSFNSKLNVCAKKYKLIITSSVLPRGRHQRYITGQVF